MKILHLGFEDHRQPGAGGGSLRNHQINSRLARTHEVEVVCAAFPGCEARVEDGVRYRHVGVRKPHVARVLSYFAALPLVVRSSPSDLVVEEFAPPFSSIGVARWARRPTVGNVQWHFARETARRYRLPGAPFAAIERWGTRGPKELIALSDDLANDLRRIAPSANVSIVGMGIDEAAFAAPPRPEPGRIAFLGRLDTGQKGLDLLVDALALLPPDARAHVLVAGDGRDRAAFERRLRTLPNPRVELLGRLSGAARWEFLHTAQLLVMPSRWETYGLVALEALACGVPVVAFDIPCLRETIPAATGVLVPAFDVPAYSRAISDLIADPERCATMGAAGRAHASSFHWDDVAAQQEIVYQRILET
jgi:glycogen synthase